MRWHAAAPLVFISYAREDKARAISLSRTLEASGFMTWLDLKDVVPGERWAQAIDRGLAAAEFIVVCVSGSSVVKRGFAQREIRRALSAEEQMLPDDIFLIPLLIEPTPIPVSLKPFQVFEAFRDADFGGLAKVLIQGCERRGIPVPAAAAPQSTSSSVERHQVDLSELGGASLLDRLRSW